MVLLTVVFLLSSCKKEGSGNYLVKTSWVTVDNGYKSELYFSDSENAVFTLTTGPSELVTYFYEYEYIHPFVLFEPQEYGVATLKGEMKNYNGEAMVIWNTSTGANLGTFRKK